MNHWTSWTTSLLCLALVACTPDKSKTVNKNSEKASPQSTASTTRYLVSYTGHVEADGEIAEGIEEPLKRILTISDEDGRKGRAMLEKNVAGDNDLFFGLHESSFDRGTSHFYFPKMFFGPDGANHCETSQKSKIKISKFTFNRRDSKDIEIHEDVSCSKEAQTVTFERRFDKKRTQIEGLEGATRGETLRYQERGFAHFDSKLNRWSFVTRKIDIFVSEDLDHISDEDIFTGEVDAESIVATYALILE